MKKHFILLIILGMSLAFTTSCLKEYLDKAPESGLTDEIVFTKYANYKLFFDAVYDGRKYYNNGWRDTWNYKSTCPLYIDCWDQKYVINSVTDACDQGRYMEGQAWKSGNMSETIISKLCYDGSRRPIMGACLDNIRVCNIAIRNADRVQDATEDEMNDFLGQAYFMRALFHYTLFRFWGPFPYMDYIMTLEDKPWDDARLPKNDYLQKCVQDWDSAFYYFNLCDIIRRDPGTLEYGTYQMHRPNGMAAKAYKARALLYAASPLNNSKGVSEWQDAAVASWEAIQLAESNGVIILPLTDASKNDRHLNFYDAEVCKESIWTRSLGKRTWNWGGGSGEIASMWGGHFMNHSSASGINPTQNWVDKYETKWGDPLNTPADREAAAALSHYNEQQPFKDRDPRFYTDIIYNGSPATGWKNGKANIYMDGSTPSELLTTDFNGRTYTGYAFRKFWANNSQKNNSVNTYWSEPLCRLSELYLDYAEAVNEGWGPTGTAGGSSLNAYDAIDVIRLKSGMPAIDRAKYPDAASLRPRIKNERNIELSFEQEFYYDDIRRWMELPQVMGSKLYAVIPQKTTVSATYPDGFVYSRTLLPIDRQTAWEEGMYYLPFLNSDALKMENFVANIVW
ncbi:MAG: RagB/SusD family nutrient uptake outer membrane protein [Bacteroidales bacterium]|nr:RagB/SusD family nutrient uptake outer membrane protein [Bacteroidales bacterium]